MPHTFPITGKPECLGIARQAILTAPDGHVVEFKLTMTLVNARVRERALLALLGLSEGWKVFLRKRNRTKEQNDKMWAMLTDISVQKPEGRTCTPDDWKCLVMNACGHDVQFMEGLDGKPFPTGFKSSQLKIGEMVTLIDWMYAYGAEHNIVWSEPKEERIIERKAG